MKYLIELVADAKGIEPAITAIDELNQAEKELKATTISGNAEQKKMMDEYAAKAKLGKASIDKLTEGYKQLGKAATGAFGGEAIKGAAKQAESFRTQLRVSRDELTRLLQTGKATTSEIYNMARGAGQLKDSVKDAQQVISVLSSDTFKFDAALQGLQVGAAGFQVLSGSAALFGSESKDLQKTLVKLNAVMAITSGLQQIVNLGQKESAFRLGLSVAAQRAYTVVVGESVGITKAFKIALASTGIGALILAVGYLIANFDKLKTSGGLVGQAIRGIGDVINLTIGLFKQLTDVLGLTDFAYSEFAERTAKNNDIILEKMEKQHKRKLALMEIQGKETLATQLKFLQEELKQSRKNNEWDDAQTEIGKERIAKQTELEESIIMLKAKIAQKGVEAQMKIEEDEKKRREKMIEDYRASLKRRRELEAEIEKARTDELQKQNELRLKNNRDTYEKDLELYKKSVIKRRQLEAEIAAQAEEFRLAESEKRRQKRRQEIEEEIAAEKEKSESISNAAIEIAQKTSDAIFQIANQRRNDEFNLQIQRLNDLKSKELSNKELTDAQKERIELRYQRQIAAIKTKQAQADKAAAIAQAIINGALAITKIFTSVTALNPASFAAIAVTAATTAAQIAIIGAQKIPKFAKGTEYVKGGGTETSDSIPAMLSKGERIIDAKTNKLLKGIPNHMIPEMLMPSATVIKEGMDYDRLAKAFSKELANNPALMVNFDKQGFTTFIKSGVTVSQIKNNRNGV
jgi:hypothetical protein